MANTKLRSEMTQGESGSAKTKVNERKKAKVSVRKPDFTESHYFGTANPKYSDSPNRPTMGSRVRYSGDREKFKGTDRYIKVK